MENSLDLSRWREAPRGIAYRRWTILSTGLRLLLRTRFFRILLALAWTGGVLVATAGLLFSQSVSSDGWLATLASHLHPRMEAVASALGGFVFLYPDICIRGWFTLVFWLQSFLGLWLSLVALTVVVPQLITRDRASNAFTVYLSRPLTSADYLLGKLGMIAGVLVLMWTGPLVFGWLLSMLFAPDRDFLVYSFAPLLRALLFNGIGLVSLAAIALGVSAVSRTSRNTVILWIALWLILGALGAPPHAPGWLRRASFSHDLGEARMTVFRLDEALGEAGDELPLANRRFAESLIRTGQKAHADDSAGALASLGIFCIASSLVFFRKLRPE